VTVIISLLINHSRAAPNVAESIAPSKYIPPRFLTQSGMLYCDSEIAVGNNVIIANNVPLGGHVTIEDNVVIGGNSAVQQFTRIGQMAMIGGMTGVLHDVIPYGLSIGNRNYLQGLNLIGLRRANFDNKDILGLIEAYKEIFATKNITDNISK